MTVHVREPAEPDCEKPPSHVQEAVSPGLVLEAGQGVQLAEYVLAAQVDCTVFVQ